MRFLLLASCLCACASGPKEGYIGGMPLRPAENFGRVAVAGNVRDVHVEALESALIEQAHGKLTIVARSEQGALASEKSLQYSGDFSDDAVVAMGKQVGAQYLFVGRGEIVELAKTRSDPEIISCAKKFSPSSGDDPKELAAKRAQRENCEYHNAEVLRLADRSYQNQVPKRRYKLKVRVIDVSQGTFVANADFVGDEGDFGECDFDCIKDKAARRAVRFLLTGSGLKPPPPPK